MHVGIACGVGAGYGVGISSAKMGCTGEGALGGVGEASLPVAESVPDRVSLSSSAVEFKNQSDSPANPSRLLTGVSWRGPYEYELAQSREARGARRARGRPAGGAQRNASAGHGHGGGGGGRRAARGGRERVNVIMTFECVEVCSRRKESLTEEQAPGPWAGVLLAFGGICGGGDAATGPLRCPGSKTKYNVAQNRYCLS